MSNSEGRPLSDAQNPTIVWRLERGRNLSGDDCLFLLRGFDLVSGEGAYRIKPHLRHHWKLDGLRLTYKALVPRLTYKALVPDDQDITLYLTDKQAKEVRAFLEEKDEALDGDEEDKRAIIQRKEFEEAAKPLMKWLCENFHPHVSVIVTPTSAELVEGIMRTRTNEFARD